MDLMYYLRVVGRHWLIAVIGLALTVGLTAIFVQRQPSVYQSTGTMVVRPRALNAEEGVRAIDALTRGVEISSTYAAIARSDLIGDRAKANIDPELDTSGTSISSEVVTSTMLVDVSVAGPDPEVVTALAREITDESVAYVTELQNVYELEVIDQPETPGDPIAPNRTLLLGTGLFFGVAVGVVFALLAEAASRTARLRRRYARSQTGPSEWLRRLVSDDSSAASARSEAAQIRDAEPMLAGQRQSGRRSRRSSA